MTSLSYSGRLLQRCRIGRNQSLHVLENQLNFVRQHHVYNTKLKSTHKFFTYSMRDNILNTHYWNRTFQSTLQYVLNSVSTLRGKRLRLFKQLYRQLTNDVRLWSNEDKVPEGFGKFFPKGKQPPKSTDGPQSKPPVEKPKEIEFKFSFGGSKMGGPGGSKPSDPNILTMVGFATTVTVLLGYTFFKTR